MGNVGTTEASEERVPYSNGLLKGNIGVHYIFNHSGKGAHNFKHTPVLDVPVQLQCWVWFSNCWVIFLDLMPASGSRTDPGRRGVAILGKTGIGCSWRLTRMTTFFDIWLCAKWRLPQEYNFHGGKTLCAMGFWGSLDKPRVKPGLEVRCEDRKVSLAGEDRPYLGSSQLVIEAVSGMVLPTSNFSKIWGQSGLTSKVCFWDPHTVDPPPTDVQWSTCMVDSALSVAQIGLIWAQIPGCWPVAGLYQLNLAGSVGIMNWRCEPHPLGLGMMPQDSSTCSLGDCNRSVCVGMCPHLSTD